MRWRIGVRKSIKIYDDRWIPGTKTTKILSPRVLALEDATVDCMMNLDSGLWNSSVIDQHFLCFEAQRIKVIPVCVSRQVDCVIWQRCKNGEYSVKTRCQLLCEDEDKGIPSSSENSRQNVFGLAFGSLEFRIKLKLFSGGCVLRLYLSKKIWRRGKSWRIQGVVYIPQHRNLHSMLYGVS